MARIAIGGVVDRGQAGVGNDGREVGATPGQERADEGDGIGQQARRTGAAEASDARAASQAHEESFSLIVGMVGGGDGG